MVAEIVRERLEAVRMMRDEIEIEDWFSAAAKRFVMRLQQLYDRGPKLTFVSPLASGIAALVMCLLVFAWPRLPRPTRRPTADVTLPLISRALWSAPLLLGPPRA